MSEYKFKVGDRVKINTRRWKLVIWWIYPIKRIVDEYTIILNDWEYDWNYSIDWFELAQEETPKKDLDYYKKTFVKANNQEELDRAVEFYKGKGYKRDEWVLEKEEFEEDYDLCIHSEKKIWKFFRWHALKDWYKDITEEVLGKKKPLMTATEAARVKDNDWCYFHPRFWWTNYQNGYQPLWVWIHELMQNANDSLLDTNKPKTMNKVRTTIRDRFFKKNGDKAIELIESTEERLDKVIDIMTKLSDFKYEVQWIIRRIENSIEENDKDALNKEMKSLQANKKELDDNLMEQFITIWEKILSAKKK